MGAAAAAVMTPAGGTVHAASLPLPEFERLDATALADELRRGRITALEALEAAIARAEARSALNALAARHFDAARETAKQLSALGRAERQRRASAAPLLGAHAARDGWNSWSRQARDAAFKALGASLPASEADWALEAYLGSAEASALRDALARQPPAFWEPVIQAEWPRGEPRRLERLVSVLSMASADPARQRRWRERFEAHAEPGVRRWAAWAWTPR